MLPTSSSKGRSGPAARPNPLFPHYLRRIVKWQQMDIEYTFWQMLHLCTSPKIVPATFTMPNFPFPSHDVNLESRDISIPSITSICDGYITHHQSATITFFAVNINRNHISSTTILATSQTKNQWARDDPAFLVICSLLLSVSTIAYSAAYDHSAGHAVVVIFSVLLFHFLVTGATVATFCWFFTNNYLLEEAVNSHVVEQRVEWLYAFDVHCNSFFPLFVLLYVFHYFLSPVLVAHGFVPVLLSNLLFMAAATYYHYLNFLGYDVLPFLERTTLFLYPIGVFFVLFPISILSGFNPSRYFMSIYFS